MNISTSASSPQQNQSQYQYGKLKTASPIHKVSLSVDAIIPSFQLY
ncbi:hypothetical protein [Lyngbya sp. PCC 8106]|nr:hypothetical protein [Lyngbya sp. PCC 8106]